MRTAGHRPRVLGGARARQARPAAAAGQRGGPPGPEEQHVRGAWRACRGAWMEAACCAAAAEAASRAHRRWPPPCRPAPLPALCLVAGTTWRRASPACLSARRPRCGGAPRCRRSRRGGATRRRHAGGGGQGTGAGESRETTGARDGMTHGGSGSHACVLTPASPFALPALPPIQNHRIFATFALTAATSSSATVRRTASCIAAESYGRTPCTRTGARSCCFLH